VRDGSPKRSASAAGPQAQWAHGDGTELAGGVLEGGHDRLELALVEIALKDRGVAGNRVERPPGVLQPNLHHCCQTVEADLATSDVGRDGLDLDETFHQLHEVADGRLGGTLIPVEDVDLLPLTVRQILELLVDELTELAAEGGEAVGSRDEVALSEVVGSPAGNLNPAWHQKRAESQVGGGGSRNNLSASAPEPSLMNALALAYDEGWRPPNRFDLEGAVNDPTPNVSRSESRPPPMLLGHGQPPLGCSKAYNRLKSCKSQILAVRFKVEMGKISKQDVEHVASLARLELSETEKGKFSEQLSPVLEYFEKLDAVDASNVTPISQINNMENIAAEDEAKESFKREEILANAPDQEDGFIKVKAVFE
jgi:aspartyl-tRNA(Asn)/glutamyl-tRNA(Gln) amidotransferase subunit C